MQVNTHNAYKENADGSTEFITDMPTTFTTVQAGKLQKRVRNYYGGPDSLARLDDQAILVDSFLSGPAIGFAL